jgi:hypothetical protein
MNKNIDIIHQFRTHLLAKIDSLTIEQLNCIPTGFANNIAWNLGHLNGVLQALCYQCSGLPITIDERHFHPFLPGTAPADSIGEDEVQLIKQQLIETVVDLRKDLENGRFQAYTKVEKIQKVYNINIATIYDALDYVTHHEGIHYHAILTLKRVIEHNNR